MQELCLDVIGGGRRSLLRCVRLCLPLAALLDVAGCTGVPAAGPQAGVAPGYGYQCFAGAYMCRLPEQVPVGQQCTCPGIGAPSYGTVR
ncbi:hypothetical protein [Lichenicoccus sp.]|uniref:hypothetical protein n=1 Tax=Lichenicoccus sp. TaxID=2781899 RepID=UPI003D0BB094